MRPRARRRIVAAALALAVCPQGASAHFERFVTSSRRVALGGAFVTVVDDASAAVIEPAALVQVPAWSIVSTYNRPYGLSDVDEAFAAAALRVDAVGVFGAAWHYTGLRDVMTESVFTFAFARDVIRTSEDASLSVGASVDVARVAARDRFDAGATAVTGGAGLLLRPFPVIGIAYAVRNITEPELDLVAGGGATAVGRSQAWGLSYWWHQRVTLSLERRRDYMGWKSHVGVEVDMGPFLALRSGMGDGAAAGGIGVAWRGVTLDAGFSSHEFLGSSYILTVGYSPRAPVNPYAQTP
jgi:hypothetical protein